MISRGLADVSTPALESLLAALERGELHAPLTRAELLANGFAGCADAVLEVLNGVARDGASAALRVVLAERAHRPPPHLDLVWTGPEARISRTRDTAVLVRQLFEDAREHVLVAGFSFDHGEDILRPLHAAMRDRAVGVDVFLDLPRAKTADVTGHVAAQVDRFLARNWPFGPPFPTLRYDPRTVQVGSEASLHAKCIVVDHRRTLITSANFTDRGQTRNLELGVLIEDPEFGGRVVAHWRGLVEEGIVEKFGSRPSQ